MLLPLFYRSRSSSLTRLSKDSPDQLAKRARLPGTLQSGAEAGGGVNMQTRHIVETGRVTAILDKVLRKTHFDLAAGSSEPGFFQ